MKNIKENIFKIKLAEDNLKRINDWINQSDFKNSIVNVLQVGIVTFSLSKFNIFKEILKNTTTNNNQILFTITICFLFFIFKSFFFSYKSLFPNITNKGMSLFFFGDISKMTHLKFLKDFKSISYKDILIDLNSQVFVNSKIATKKMENVGKSIKSLFISLLLLIYILICKL